jgi:hypothetical protein
VGIKMAKEQDLSLIRKISGVCAGSCAASIRYDLPRCPPLPAQTQRHHRPKGQREDHRDQRAPQRRHRESGGARLTFPSPTSPSTAGCPHSAVRRRAPADGTDLGPDALPDGSRSPGLRSATVR